MTCVLGRPTMKMKPMLGDRETEAQIPRASFAALHSLARMGSQEGPCTFSGQRQCLSLGPTNVVVSCTNVGPVRRRAIDSSELRPHH